MKSLNQVPKNQLKILWKIVTAFYLAAIWMLLDMQKPDLLSSRVILKQDPMPFASNEIRSDQPAGYRSDQFKPPFTQSELFLRIIASQVSETPTENHWGLFLPFLAQTYQTPIIVKKPVEGIIVPEKMVRINDINFTPNTRKILLEITPPNKKVNAGKNIRISFIPGKKCEFGEKRACVYQIKNGTQNQIIFISVHSGVGGEGQKYRHAIEGTGVNRTGFEISRIQSNMKNLAQSNVVLKQGDILLQDLELTGIVRIPPSELTDYFSKPVEQLLSYLVENHLYLEQLIEPDKKYIILETCGWKLPGEPGAKYASDTTGSVYLSVIAINEPDKLLLNSKLR